MELQPKRGKSVIEQNTLIIHFMTKEWRYFGKNIKKSEKIVPIYVVKKMMVTIFGMPQRK